MDDLDFAGTGFLCQEVKKYFQGFFVIQVKIFFDDKPGVIGKMLFDVQGVFFLFPGFIGESLPRQVVDCFLRISFKLRPYDSFRDVCPFAQWRLFGRVWCIVFILVFLLIFILIIIAKNDWESKRIRNAFLKCKGLAAFVLKVFAIIPA